MTIQINTDNNVENSARLKTYFTEELEKSLARFEDKVTRLEVHFTDENGDKFGLNDKRCVIEARPENLQPIAVTEHAETIEKAFSGALEKIKKVLTTTYDKKKSY